MPDNPYRPPAAQLEAAPTLAGTRPCPKCGAPTASKVSFTWWGGALGPLLFHVVKCLACGAQYNGRTGGTLGKVIVFYQLIAFGIAGAALAWLIWPE